MASTASMRKHSAENGVRYLAKNNEYKKIFEKFGQKSLESW
jgi:hypothetical protein